MSNVKELWDRQTPKQKKMFVWVGSITVLLGGVWIMDQFQNPKSNRPVQTERRVERPASILSDPETGQLTISELQQQVRRLQASTAELQEELLAKEQESRLQAEQLQAQLATVISQLQHTNQTTAFPDDLATQLARQVADAEERLRQQQLQLLRQQTENDAPPIEPVTPVTPSQPAPPTQDVNQLFERQQRPGQQPDGVSRPATVNDEGQSTLRSGALTIRDARASEPQSLVEAGQDGNSTSWYLQTGAILEGVLLTGLDAPTSMGARADNTFALFRLQKEAILPNFWEFDIRECFALIEGYGDLASERAMLRGRTLSCVDGQGRVMETSLPAYAVGEDGKAGVRGRLVSKQGQLIARAMMAGFAQGIAEIFRPNLGQIGGIDDVNRDNLSQIGQGAALSGTSNAMQKVAEFYIAMAENIYPVIEVDAGRRIQLIVSSGTALNFQFRNDDSSVNHIAPL